MISQGVNLVTRGMIVHKPCTIFTSGIILCDYISTPTPPQPINYGGSSWRRPSRKEKVPNYKEISIVFEFSGDTKTMIKKKYSDISVKKYDSVEIREGYIKSKVNVIVDKKFN